MRRTATLLLALAALGAVAETPTYKRADAPVADRVADLLGRMTVEEKAGQLLCPMGWEVYVKNDDGAVEMSEKCGEQNGGGMRVG